MPETIETGEPRKSGRPRKQPSAAEPVKQPRGRPPLQRKVLPAPRDTAVIPPNMIVLRGVPVEISSHVGHTFVVDACRSGEGLRTDQELCEIYELTPEDLLNITKNKTLINALRAERERRVRSGTAARESAAAIFVAAPKVMGQILNDNSASPRHRLEASKELRATAAGVGDENAHEDGERFVININLGGDYIEHFDKAIKPMKPVVPVNEVWINEEE